MGGKVEHLDHYSRFVEWSEEDYVWIGYCPDLFPYGAVCHGSTSWEVFAHLSQLIEEELIQLVESGSPVPKPKELVSI
jgi:predicted RNase H-like HicB family nuclease